MRLIKINDKLWVNAERVIAVEERTINNDRGPKTFVELTLDSVGRWQLDMPMTTVLTALHRGEQ